MPNKENIKKVVDALRSGEYLQGNGALEYVDLEGKTRNCCLGVACRVAVANGVDLLVISSAGSLNLGNGQYVDKLGFDGMGDFLPNAVMDWLGIPNHSPALNVVGRFNAVTATMMNDDLKYDFNRIADAFEDTFLSPVGDDGTE